MKVSVIIVGVGQWKKFTKPLIDSIVEHEPDVHIIVVDNGDEYPREYKEANIVSIKPVVCYAQAINVGKNFVHDADWVIVLNNDVKCNAPFIKMLEEMNDRVLYGNKIHKQNHKRFMAPTDWIDGWLYAIPKTIFESVGKWDKKFEIAGFEDADYCIRAMNIGFSVEKSVLPFKHLEYHIRKKFNNYAAYRESNLRHLVKKHGLETF